MKKIILSVLICLPVLFYGQEEKISKLKCEVFFSPNYSYRTLFNPSEDTVAESIIKSYNEREEPILGYTAGTVLDINLKNERLYLQTGILFSYEGYKYHLDNVVCLHDYNYDTCSINARHVNIFSYFPINLKYYLTTKDKLKIFINSGIAPSIYVASRYFNEYNYNDGTTEKEKIADGYSGITTFNALAQIGFGAEYKLKENLFLYLQPTFRYMLFTIGPWDAPIKEHPYSVGIATGITFSKIKICEPCSFF